MPIAASRLRQEVEIAGISPMGRSPSLMIEPLPNCFSICEIAISMARFRSLRSSGICLGIPFSLFILRNDGLYHDRGARWHLARSVRFKKAGSHHPRRQDGILGL